MAVMQRGEGYVATAHVDGDTLSPCASDNTVR